MRVSSFKSRTLKSFFWSALDKLITFAGQLIFGVILARVLYPKDFGLIGMISIFLALTQSFSDSGLNLGLIQKKSRTDKDFSTVFIFNSLTSLLFYLVLFALSPLIADFYNEPDLVLILRIYSFNLLLTALTSIQRTILTIELDFRAIAQINTTALIISGISAIILAYSGYGVWALIIQSLTRSSIQLLAFWYNSKWKPALVFSKKSFTELFKFGYKLLISGVIAQAFNNVYNVIIGKNYSSADLGFYDRAKNLSEIVSGTASSVLSEVTYPIFASINEDSDRTTSVYQRILGMTSFIIFPIMTLTILLAEPIVTLVLTEKWLPIVPLLQWFCLSRIFYPLTGVNLNLINSIGRSDLTLKINLIKLVFATITMLFTINMGIKAMIIGQAINSFVAFFINSYLPGKYFGYGPFLQIKDMSGIILSTVVMIVVTHYTTISLESPFMKILAGTAVGGISYVLIGVLVKRKEITELSQIVLNYKN